MVTTSAEGYEIYGDSTMVGLHERFIDVLTEPVPEGTALVSLPSTAFRNAQEAL